VIGALSLCGYARLQLHADTLTTDSAHDSIVDWPKGTNARIAGIGAEFRVVHLALQVGEGLAGSGSGLAGGRGSIGLTAAASRFSGSGTACLNASTFKLSH
jgi:hypothetical protein